MTDVQFPVDGIKGSPASRQAAQATRADAIAAAELARLATLHAQAAARAHAELREQAEPGLHLAPEALAAGAGVDRICQAAERLAVAVRDSDGWTDAGAVTAERTALRTLVQDLADELQRERQTVVRLAAELQRQAKRTTGGAGAGAAVGLGSYPDASTGGRAYLDQALPGGSLRAYLERNCATW